MNRKPHVLVVDDDSSTRRTLKLIFEKNGYRVATAESGREALENARGRRFNLALLDVRLPDVEGIDLIASLKEMHPQMAVIIITGHASIRTAVQALNAGAVSYVTKPLDLDELLAIAREALEKQQLTEEKQQAEEALKRRADNLRAINELAINLTTAQPSTNPFKLIADELRSITGALAVSVSAYDPDEQALIVKYLAAEGGLVAQLNDLLGRDIIGLSTPVNEERYAQMINEIVRTAPDLHATTFGSIPKPISTAVQKLLGIDRFIGLALTERDRLIGTSVIVIPSGQPPPSNEVVQIFARVAAASLRQRQVEEALEQRATHLAVLNDIGARIASVLDLEAVLESAVRLIQENFEYHHVALFTLDDDQEKLVMRARAGDFAHLFPPNHQLALGEGIVGWVGQRGHRLLANDVDKDPRYVNCYPEFIRTQSELSVPVQIAGDVVGVLDVQSEHRDAFDENDVLAVETLADQIAVAMENARLYDIERDARGQLRQLTSYLQDAREKERKRIARRIHDELGQALTALRFDLYQLAKRLPEDDPGLRERADAMEALIDDTIHTVRRVSRELRPGLLDDLGLAAAIEWQAEEFAQRTGIKCTLHLSEDDATIEPNVATAVFRIFQETLTNVARHASASEVCVELEVGPRELTLMVRDDGRGITQRESSSPQALGLLGIRERAWALGGEATFEGIRGQGTTVTVRVPREEQ